MWATLRKGGVPTPNTQGGEQSPVPARCPPAPTRPILARVGEEARLVRLHDDHIEELAPVRTHHVPHSLVPEHTWGRGRTGGTWSEGGLGLPAAPQAPPSSIFPRWDRAHTKLKGLLVMRNSCFPWSTRRLRTANVSSPLRMYFSNRGRRACEGQPCALPGHAAAATVHPYPCPARSTGT